MKSLAIVAGVYGGLILLGGVMGFVKGKSKASLVTGILFGIALIVCGVLIQQGVAAGCLAATLLAGVLVLVFVIRFLKTRKLMPAGLLAVISLVAAVWLARGIGS